ncbi:Tsr2p [Rhodotorula paludigena]|uniref:Tsr2p n=1 Tax=Rhodotorula paludigena TaxID=86838 RepID=UPI00318218FF
MSAPAVPAPSPEEQALGLFARSALDLFDMWPALRLAISQGWGGDGKQGKTHLAEDVVDLFYTVATSGPESAAEGAQPQASTSTHEGGIPVPAQDELEQTLLYVVEQEFDVDLEDASERLVARDLILLWRECLRRVTEGRTDDEGELAKRFREGAERARAQDGQGRFEAQRGGDAGDDSSDDDEDGSDDEQMEGVEDVPQLVPTEQAPPRERQEPIVDEDGFEMVQTKKKGGRR